MEMNPLLPMLGMLLFMGLLGWNIIKFARKIFRMMKGYNSINNGQSLIYLINNSTGLYIACLVFILSAYTIIDLFFKVDGGMRVFFDFLEIFGPLPLFFYPLLMILIKVREVYKNSIHGEKENIPLFISQKSTGVQNILKIFSFILLGSFILGLIYDGITHVIMGNAGEWVGIWLPLVIFFNSIFILPVFLLIAFLGDKNILKK